MQRREFLKSSALALAGLSLSTYTLGQNLNTGESSYDYAIILSTVKEEMQKNPKKVFKKLAKLGYKYVEGVGRYDVPAEVTMPYIEKYGLKPIATGNSLYPLTQDPQKEIAQAKKYNMDYLVCYWPWLDGAKDLSKAQCLESAEKLEAIGKACYDAGLKFAWHNHDKEFLKLKDSEQTPFEIIMQHTDSKHVYSELDVYWVEKAGKSALETIKSYPDRIGLLHLKDMTNDDTQDKTCPGNGKIDFGPILAQKDKTAIDYLIVEQESTEDGLLCAKESMNYLKQF